MSNRKVRQARQTVQFSLRSKRGIGNIDAQVAGEELARIHERDGQLQAAVVVEEARPKEALLHPAFEWRDRIAAESYREWQARMLIKSVYVITEANETPAQVYVYCPDPQTEGAKSGYQPVSVVVQNPSMWATALAEANRKVTEAEASLRRLKEAAEGSDDAERLARISIAIQAANALQEAVRGLH